MLLNNQSLVYLGAFALTWLSITSLSLYPALVAVLAIAVGTQALASRAQKAPAIWWRAALMGIAVAEVFFAVSFWSTPARNKALIMIAVLFVFGQWFDKINLRWLIVFLLVLLGTLFLVPFQAL